MRSPFLEGIKEGTFKTGLWKETAKQMGGSDLNFNSRYFITLNSSRFSALFIRM